MKLPDDLTPVVDALAELRKHEEREERATELRKNAEIALAEVVDVRRRDKDTGFEAEHTARDLIVTAVLEARDQERDECPKSCDGAHDDEDHGGGVIKCKVCGVPR